MISLASSQILRWIDELNGLYDGDAEARRIRAEINRIKKEPNSVQNRKEMRRLYAKLDEVQFKPDYINIIMDRNSDYKRLCRGFKINGIRIKDFLEQITESRIQPSCLSANAYITNCSAELRTDVTHQRN